MLFHPRHKVISNEQYMMATMLTLFDLLSNCKNIAKTFEWNISVWSVKLQGALSGNMVWKWPLYKVREYMYMYYCLFLLTMLMFFIWVYFSCNTNVSTSCTFAYLFSYFSTMYQFCMLVRLTFFMALSMNLLHVYEK